MHSKSLAMHQQAKPVCKQYAPHGQRTQQQHHAIIAQFNRYPHRNAILSRDSTPSDIAFLSQPRSCF